MRRTVREVKKKKYVKKLLKADDNVKFPLLDILETYFSFMQSLINIGWLFCTRAIGQSYSRAFSCLWNRETEQHAGIR